MALQQIEKLYQKLNPNTNESMLKNFVIKVMSWSDFVFPELFCSWNERVSPKFIYYGSGIEILIFSSPVLLMVLSTVLFIATLENSFWNMSSFFTSGIIISPIYCVRIEGEEQSYDTDQVIKYNTYQDLALIRIERSSPLAYPN